MKCIWQDQPGIISPWPMSSSSRHYPLFPIYNFLFSLSFFCCTSSSFLGIFPSFQLCTLSIPCTPPCISSWPASFFFEICYITVIVPQMLASISDFHRTIPLVNCAIQMFFFITLGSTDCFMLSVMAYDRYVAICHPLRYTLIMTWWVCIWLVIGSLILSIMLCLQVTALVFSLSFCGIKPKINHFFCDVPPVLQVACADTHLHQTALFCVVTIVLTVPFVLICIFYVHIVAAILRIKSSCGRHKAFSTCSSHLTVVFLQYGVCSLVYLHPKSRALEGEDRKLALNYTFVTPLLNPLIYTLRNQDIKQALRKVMKKMVTSQN